MRICSVPGCHKPANTKGWCGAHYMRWTRHGDPTGGRTGNGEPQQFYRDVVLAYEGDDCLIWPYGTHECGYGRMWVGTRPHGVHRLACEEVNGPPPSPEHEAAHLCGNGHLGCVNKRHVAWKTPAENTADKFLHGTVRRGSEAGGAKLSDADVIQIREMKGKVPQKEVARQFGVTQSTVSLVQNRVNWSWL